MLVTELAKLKVNAKPVVYITHLKPGEAEKIMQEIGESPNCDLKQKHYKHTKFLLYK